MRFHPYRLSLGGALSLAHLAAVAIALIIMVTRQSVTATRIAVVLQLPLLLLSPVSTGFLTPSNRLFIFCILLPANSYLWGHAIAGLFRLVHAGLTFRATRLRNGQCPACAYDLRGSRHSDRCPECGEPIPPQLRPDPTFPIAE